MNRSPQKIIKCLIWDLDNTVWSGILAEGDDVQLRPGVLSVLKTLDSQGILFSIASRSDRDRAITRLKELEIDHFFLVPQINWGAKSASVEHIAKVLSIGIDSLAFIDDDPFERAEVQHALPDVLCFDALDHMALTDLAEFKPENVNQDSRRRRQMYVDSFDRDAAETAFQGPPGAFLSNLELKVTIGLATEEDLARAEELTLRTNQFNATGETFSRAEIQHLILDPDWLVVIINVSDRFGDYGRVGLCLIDISGGTWSIRLLLFSCRVISRGLGSMFLTWIGEQASRRNIPLNADFVPTDRNRAMLIAYRFSGYEAQDGEADTGKRRVLCFNLSKSRPMQKHFHIELEEDLSRQMDDYLTRSIESPS